ncbi:MAG: hypothetical protein ACR2L2_11330 [Acidobacteriota bacterium]
MSAASIAFELKSGDLQVRAPFAEPAFGLFQDFPGLCQRLYGALASYGVALGDMKFEGSAGSLGDVHLAVTVLRASAVLRVRLDYVELQCFNVRNADEKDLAEVFVQTSQVVADHSPVAAAVTYSLAVGLHGSLDGVPTSNFIQRFVTAQGLPLGPPSGVGAVLYFGPHDSRLGASVTLDLSAMVPDGLFLRSNAIWKASSVDARALPAKGREFFDQVTTELGLTVR